MGKGPLDLELDGLAGSLGEMVEVHPEGYHMGCRGCWNAGGKWAGVWQDSSSGGGALGYMVSLGPLPSDEILRGHLGDADWFPSL